MQTRRSTRRPAVNLRGWCGTAVIMVGLALGSTALPAGAAGRVSPSVSASGRAGGAQAARPSYYSGQGSYWMVGADGSVYALGPTAANDGTLRGKPLNEPIVGGAAGAYEGEGYWLVASDGGIFAYTAPFLGSEGGHPLNKPIVGMATDWQTGGYWEVASDGGIFSFTAPFYGSTGSLHLNAPIVGMAVTPTAKGYWLIASDGGVFSFGSAATKFYGSTGAIRLNKPIVGMAATPTGDGYYLVASDGGIFAFSKTPAHPAAPFRGSTGAMKLNKPIVGMGLSNTGSGYWLVASDGGIFSFTAPFVGSVGGTAIPAPVVTMMVVPPPYPYVWSMAVNPTGNGYWLSDIEGGAYPFGAARTWGTTFTTVLSSPMIGIASDHSGNGYWMVQADGAVHHYGNAPDLGSAPPPTGGDRRHRGHAGRARDRVLARLEHRRGVPVRERHPIRDTAEHRCAGHRHRRHGRDRQSPGLLPRNSQRRGLRVRRTRRSSARCRSGHQARFAGRRCCRHAHRGGLSRRHRGWDRLQLRLSSYGKYSRPALPRHRPRHRRLTR